MVAIKDKLDDKDYQAGGQYRDDALWRFEFADETKDEHDRHNIYYRIYNNR